MRMGYEHCCERRHARGVRTQCFVRAFRGVRARSGVNSDEFAAVVGNHEVILGELESRKCIHTSGHGLADPPGNKRMACRGVFCECRVERERPVEVAIAAKTQILLCLLRFVSCLSKLRLLVVHLAKISAVRRFLGVCGAPGEFLARFLLLIKPRGKLRSDVTSEIVHDKDVSVRKLLGPIQHADGVANIRNAMEQENIVCVLSAQHTDGAQVKGFLGIAEARFEFAEPLVSTAAGQKPRPPLNVYCKYPRARNSSRSATSKKTKP